MGREGLDERTVGWAVPLPFEADEEVDLRGVLFAQALGFSEVGFVAGGEDGEGCLGVSFFELVKIVRMQSLKSYGYLWGI